MNSKDFPRPGRALGDGRIASRRIVFPDFFMRRVLNALIFTGDHDVPALPAPR